MLLNNVAQVLGFGWFVLVDCLFTFLVLDFRDCVRWLVYWLFILLGEVVRYWCCWLFYFALWSLLVLLAVFDWLVLVFVGFCLDLDVFLCPCFVVWRCAWSLFSC